MQVFLLIGVTLACALLAAALCRVSTTSSDADAVRHFVGGDLVEAVPPGLRKLQGSRQRRKQRMPGVWSQQQEAFNELPGKISLNDFTCLLVLDIVDVRNTIFGGLGRDIVECIPRTVGAGIKPRRSYLVTGLTPQFLDEHGDEIGRGELEAVMSNVVLFPRNNTLAVTEDSIFTFQRRRSLQFEDVAKRTGTRKVLAFTISTSDVRNTFRDYELRPYLFGTDRITMESQFAACSGGQLSMEPLRDGVKDIDLPGRASDYTPRDAAFAAIGMYEQELGIDNLEDEADHLMFCLPPGMAQFVASAVNNNPRSIYDDLNCARMSVFMHELAHNMGLNHASKRGERYKDLTGYMGSSQRQMEGPQKCYNAAQHWKLGWYNDLSFIWNGESSSPKIIDLAPFVDYTAVKADATSQKYVLISLADELFLQLNLAWSFNEGTGDYEDMVTVVNGTDDNLLDGLDDTLHTTLTVPDFHGGTLVVEVCRMEINKVEQASSIAVLSVGLGGSICSPYRMSRERGESAVGSSQVGDRTFVNKVPGKGTNPFPWSGYSRTKPEMVDRQKDKMLRAHPNT